MVAKTIATTLAKTMLPVAAGLLAFASPASAGHEGCAARAVECYHKVPTPAVYANVERPVVVAPARTEVVYNPAVVQQRPYRVQLAPQRIYREHVPAAYATVMRRHLVAPARVGYVTHPAVVRRVHETVAVSPGSVRWQRTVDAHGRERLCKVASAPQTRSVVRDVVVAPARRIPVMTPAIYRESPIPVLVRPAHTRHVVEPAVHAVVHTPVVLKPAAIRIIDHPPVTGVESRRVQVSAPGYAWARDRD